MSQAPSSQPVAQQSRRHVLSQADAGYFSAGYVDRHDCQASDFNQDGLEDLFCSVAADRGNGVKSNALEIRQPDHTFVDRANQ
jgi:hypothetical protein